MRDAPAQWSKISNTSRMDTKSDMYLAVSPRRIFTTPTIQHPAYSHDQRRQRGSVSSDKTCKVFHTPIVSVNHSSFITEQGASGQ